MVSANTLCKRLLNVKNCVIENLKIEAGVDGTEHIRIAARPTRWHENDCPICHKRCPRYDSKCKSPRIWRGLDWEGIIVEVEYRTHRIVCPEHGVLVADVPWAYPGSRFTKNFDLTVGWLAVYLPRSVVSEYMRIDWETVGRCVHRTLKDIAPNRARRLDGLVRIGIDETSYKKGHKYITVIVNHDTNTVVWAAQGHGKTVLEAFYRQLSKEQLASIQIVTGDGAKWITECVEEFTPECERCVDPFHVVGWAMEALDEVRREAWKEARDEVKRLARENPVKRGRPGNSDLAAAALREAKGKAEEIKGADDEENANLIALSAKLDAIMADRELYTRPNLKISELAETAGTNRTYVSNAINGIKGISFSDYVNSFRIKRAKELMLSRENSFTMSVVAEKSGFLSEATFYRQFKAVTGLTPNQWLHTVRG